jgi:23S rRNA (cytidine1920-2'-O)/16S rRNA (cytidine1409-2'-O)-methyltransferase
VVRDPEVHQRILLDVLAFAQQEGFQVQGLARSPVLGPKGNVEFLGWLNYSEGGDPAQISVDELVSAVLDHE